jgi:hypothetical protein
MQPEANVRPLILALAILAMALVLAGTLRFATDTLVLARAQIRRIALALPRPSHHFRHSHPGLLQPQIDRLAYFDSARAHLLLSTDDDDNEAEPAGGQPQIDQQRGPLHSLFVSGALHQGRIGDTLNRHGDVPPRLEEHDQLARLFERSVVGAGILAAEEGTRILKGALARAHTGLWRQGSVADQIQQTKQIRIRRRPLRRMLLGGRILLLRGWAASRIGRRHRA